jgi:hypothetical protein
MDKVAMLHSGRCGSTVLGSLMNQNPDMFWWGEPFEKRMNAGAALSLEDTVKIIRAAEQTKISKIYSFATKYLKDMHLSADCINMEIDSYINMLRELGYNKFIVIDRTNHLKRAISMEIGRKWNEWHSTEEAKEAHQVTLDPLHFQIGLNTFSSLIDYFKSLDTEFRNLLSALEGEQVLTVNYEKDIEHDPVIAYEKVCSFLGSNPGKPVVTLKKTNPFPVSELVKNFDSVKKTLLGTEYEWMLFE